ncbi:AraC family transcriptional regulator [Paenibacillus mesophilus]|uniref:AraC family transcriptional regulator n=1 Tax=Paenibacillus mesophilus TaxID=2582849 RepID=UPI00110D77B7|nr:AraC family transcriptional regulator [Paenibacillus mesophilus]TMV52740.1 AraC family transcriptional regulator [Paenibacillus mesophilus]
MLLYSKSACLESEEFPFQAFLFSTSPQRPRTVHCHEFIELVYVSEGHGEHLYKGSAYPISTGDIFVVPPFVEHDYNVIGGMPLKVYNVLFLPSFLTFELQALSNVTPFFDFFYVEPFFRQTLDFDSHMKLSVLEDQEMKQRLDRIVGEFSRKALGYRISIKAQLIDMLVWLSRRYEERIIAPPPRRSQPEAIKAVCEFIEQHYAQDISLEQISRMCTMSQSSFGDKFKKYVGKTFTEYRNEVRINASLKLLRETDLNTLSIAENVGIHDLSHYYKLFRQYTGMTPRIFRMKYAGERAE